MESHLCNKPLSRASCIPSSRWSRNNPQRLKLYSLQFHKMLSASSLLKLSLSLFFSSLSLPKYLGVNITMASNFVFLWDAEGANERVSAFVTFLGLFFSASFVLFDFIFVLSYILLLFFRSQFVSYSVVVDLDGREHEGGLGGIEGAETIIRIYDMEKICF